MTHRKERFVESFVFIMFPVALLVACSTDIPDTQPATPPPSAIALDTNALINIPTTLHVKEANTHATNIQNKMSTTSTTTTAVNKTVEQKIDLQAPAKSIFLFEKNKTSMNVEDIQYLKQHAEFLLIHPQLSLTISGHTDKSGNSKYNQTLSELRAQNVATQLIKDGVPESRLVVEGYGDTVPYSNAGKLSQNRRVELQYSSL